MNFFDLFKTALKEEVLPENKKGILLLDIDDTLSKSDPNVMHIYRKLPTDKEEIALTTDEYAKESVTKDTKKYYDYRDFRDPKKTFASIVKASPLLNNLRAVDAFYNGGYDLGVLTARGCEDAVADGIRRFLMVRDKNGKLIKPNMNRENIHAVNDDDKQYAGSTDFEKKQNVLRDYARKYDFVYFIDDDPKNLKAVKALKKDPEIANKLRTIDAKRNVQIGKKLDESVIMEMAVKDVDADIIRDITNQNYGDALSKYFNKIKDTTTYAKKGSNREAFNHMLSYGITRTFGALEKSNKIPAGSSDALKKYGSSHANEIIGDMPEREVPEQETKAEEQPKEKKLAKGEYPKYENNETGALKKIADRVAKYEKMQKDIDDYAFTSKSITPFIVNIRKNGPDGVEAGTDKPKLTEIDKDNPLLSKTDRYIAPMLKFRQNFIPDFIQKEVDKGLEGKGSMYVSGEDVKNIQKAETLGKEYVEATKNRIYALAMKNFLNNIVMGLRDFNIELKKEGKEFTDKEVLDRLKNDEFDFPYKDFVRLEKWSKSTRMAVDKAKDTTDEKVGSRAQIPDEVLKVRQEYITFLNALEKAQAEGKTADFISENLAIIRAALETPIDRKSKQTVSSPIDELKAFNKKAEETSKSLVPTLKDRYTDRADENFDKDFVENYRAIDNKLTALMLERKGLIGKEGREEDLHKVENKLDSMAKVITDIFLDRLAGLDIVVSCANSGLLGQTEETIKRYKDIKQKYAKMMPSAKKSANIYDPNSDKYKQYYDPEGDEKDKAASEDAMYKEIDKAFMDNFDKIVANKLQLTMLNIRGKKYNSEELGRLYKAYKEQGVDAMIDLLKTPEFKAKRD